MSGGPLLNLQGQVVGVNGKHSYPLFGERSAYMYENGSLVEEEMELLKRSSWAIPIETLVLTAKPTGICLAYSDGTIIPECQQQEERVAENERSPATDPLNPSNPDLTPEQLKELAKKITVRVKLTIGNEDIWYSGFIVEQNRKETGYFYKAVTYVGQRDVISYSIVKPDGHSITALEKPKEIIISDGNKLVEIKFFDNSQSYETSKFGVLSALKTGDRVFAAGYQLDKSSTKDANSSMLNRATSKLELVSGNIVSIRDSNDSRIHLSNSLNEEMLGGPLINSQGEVIGINGKHEETVNVSPTAPNGHAIPIQEYLSLKKRTELLSN
jgi:S1-C subfamily serine protease